MSMTPSDSGKTFWHLITAIILTSAFDELISIQVKSVIKNFLISGWSRRILERPCPSEEYRSRDWSWQLSSSLHFVMRELKVVVLGSGGVGKSALTVKFVSGKFIERYDPTIEDFYRKEIEVDGSPSVLEILDTAGTEQFASMRDLYIKNGQGFIIVYSITSLQTFYDIRSMKEHIQRLKGRTEIPILLVGNKADLENQREVTTCEANALAQTWGCSMIEASARSAHNVNEVFIEIVRQMTSPAPRETGCCVLS